MKSNKKSAFWIVFLKELKDLFRDKKTIISTIIIPIIIYPAMMFLIGGGISSITGGDADVNIAVAGELEGGGLKTLEAADRAAAEKIFENYNELKPTRKITVADSPPSDLFKLLENGKINLIITFEDGINQIEQSGRAFRVGYILDNRSNSGAVAMSEVMSVIDGYAGEIYRQRLERDVEDITKYEAITQGAVLPLDELIERTGTGNSFIIMIIPMLITMLVSIGGATVAVDLIAGEKERGTFEPLLSTGAGRFPVLTAKYAVVIVFALLNGLVQVAALSVSILSVPQLRESMGNGALSLSAGSLLLGAVNILLLAAFFCSVMLCLASTAKTFKEASAKTSFLVFLPIILSYSVMFKDAVSIGISYMFIPIVNVVSVVKMILSGYVNYTYFLIAAGVNGALLGAAVYLTFKMFSKENLITRG